MPVAIVVRLAARSAVTASRYASKIVRGRSASVMSRVPTAWTLTKPIRRGYSMTRAYTRKITGNDRKSSNGGTKRRRSASLEYIYKY